MSNRKPYPSEVSDNERTSAAPYLTLRREDGEQREHSLREVFNGRRWIVRTGSQWRMMPHDLTPWDTVSRRAWRSGRAGCFVAILDDLRMLL